MFKLKLWYKEHRFKIPKIFHHLLFVYAIYIYGLNWQYLVVSLLSGYLGFILFAHYGIHHRFSHGIYKTTILNVCLTFGILVFTAITSPLNFIILHRHHHKYGDTRADAHSPKYIGWYRVYFLFWKKVYINPSLGRDIARSRFQIFIHKNFIFLHFFIISFLALIDFRFVAFCISPCVIYTFHINGLINCLGHRYGLPRNAPELILLTPLTWKHGDHHNIL